MAPQLEPQPRPQRPTNGCPAQSPLLLVLLPLYLCSLACPAAATRVLSSLSSTPGGDSSSSGSSGSSSSGGRGSTERHGGRLSRMLITVGSSSSPVLCPTSCAMQGYASSELGSTSNELPPAASLAQCVSKCRFVEYYAWTGSQCYCYTDCEPMEGLYFGDGRKGTVGKASACPVTGGGTSDCEDGGVLGAGKYPTCCKQGGVTIMGHAAAQVSGWTSASGMPYSQCVGFCAAKGTVYYVYNVQSYKYSCSCFTVNGATGTAPASPSSTTGLVAACHSTAPKAPPQPKPKSPKKNKSHPPPKTTSRKHPPPH